MRCSYGFLIIALLTICLVFLMIDYAKTNEYYVYCGYVPSRAAGEFGYLIVVGINSSTKVNVIDLVTDRVISSFEVGRMDVFILKLNTWNYF